jgi:hypothetical protein
MVVETSSGLILGATCLGCDRAQPVPVAARGVVNTISVLLGYVGYLPAV